jgi:parallel beta-helix repeat protein
MPRKSNPAEFRLKSALFRAMAMAGLALGAAHATTYNITNTTMAFSNDGICGFMEALAANNLRTKMNECVAPVGATTINLSPGTYTPPWGIEVWANVNIRCPSGTCTIDAGSLNEDLFTIDRENNPIVSLYRLTLKQPASNTNSVSGLVVLGGTLKLEESVVNGFLTVGVSIRAGTGHSILRSTLSNNGYGLNLWDGVGLASQSNAVSNNWMGVLVGTGNFTDLGSVISNSVDAGLKVGAADGGGNITLENTTIRGNRNRGVYMYPNSNAWLYHCVIEGNKTPGNGAGMFLDANPNINGNIAFAQIFNTTISNNRATGNGGGLYVAGSATLTNCTISKDTAAQGGGSWSIPNASNAYLLFNNCTLAFNHATVSGGGITSVPGTGAQVVGIFRSIVARNTSKSHPDISGLRNSGVSLFGDLTGSPGFHAPDAGPDIIGDPLLGDLKDNAGPYRVKTHALLKGSPAIDQLSIVGDLTDGRGLYRPATGKWDMGAYEAGAAFETELLTVISKSSDTHVIQTSASLSRSAGTVLNANAVGDYVTYAVSVPEPGTYSIGIGTMSGPTSAIVELATAPGDDQFTTIGTFDMFKPSSQPGTYGLSFTFTSGSVKYFRLKVTGRNNLNTTGYKCFYDYIKISRL